MTTDIKLKKLLSEELIEAIIKINLGEEEYYQSSFICGDFAQKVLEKEGFKRGSLDINGWECNWNTSITHPEFGTYYMNGDGFYGGFSISKDKDY